MNDKRCAIFLGDIGFATTNLDIDYEDVYVSKRNEITAITSLRRIFGSHSEAKRELEKWLPEWSDAKIVEESEL